MEPSGPRQTARTVSLPEPPPYPALTRMAQLPESEPRSVGSGCARKNEEPSSQPEPSRAKSWPLSGGPATRPIWWEAASATCSSEPAKDFDVATDAPPEPPTWTSSPAPAGGRALRRGPRARRRLPRRGRHLPQRRRLHRWPPPPAASTSTPTHARTSTAATSPSTACCSTPNPRSLLDYVGGRADLAARILRAIGDPDAPLPRRPASACCAPSVSPPAWTSLSRPPSHPPQRAAHPRRSRPSASATNSPACSPKAAPAAASSCSTPPACLPAPAPKSPP